MATTIKAPVLWQCGYCGHIDDATSFYPGRGREVGEHPEYLYCHKCEQSVTWFGARVVR